MQKEKDELANLKKGIEKNELSMKLELNKFQSKNEYYEEKIRVLEEENSNLKK